MVPDKTRWTAHAYPHFPVLSFGLNGITQRLSTVELFRESDIIISRELKYFDEYDKL